MASRIQGITGEIGGDTTKLSKALESVNKSIKGTQSGLKDVNKLLKLDPSNTELVVQKQKMLKDAIEATKEKLATLKTAAQQANEQLANGEISMAPAGTSRRRLWPEVAPPGRPTLAVCISQSTVIMPGTTMNSHRPLPIRSTA